MERRVLERRVSEHWSSKSRIVEFLHSIYRTIMSAPAEHLESEKLCFTSPSITNQISFEEENACVNTEEGQDISIENDKETIGDIVRETSVMSDINMSDTRNSGNILAIKGETPGSSIDSMSTLSNKQSNPSDIALSDDSILSKASSMFAQGQIDELSRVSSKLDSNGSKPDHLITNMAYVEANANNPTFKSNTSASSSGFTTGSGSKNCGYGVNSFCVKSVGEIGPNSTHLSSSFQSMSDTDLSSNISNQSSWQPDHIRKSKRVKIPLDLSKRYLEYKRKGSPMIDDGSEFNDKDNPFGGESEATSIRTSDNEQYSCDDDWSDMVNGNQQGKQLTIEECLPYYEKK
eukprot:scaffold127412_cov99-Cyclotella_meneghiniana.AAC.2